MSEPKVFQVAAVLSLAVLSQVAAPPLTANDGKVPLGAALISFSHATGVIEFDVYSHSETPVVAWDIQVVVRHGDGGEYVSTHGWDYWLAGSDRYLEYGRSRRAKFLLSHLVQSADLGEPPIELIPASAVFSDGRSAGKPQLVESIFLLRAGRLSEFCRLAAVFDAASREANSTRELQESLRDAIDSVADVPISPKSGTSGGASTAQNGQDRYHAGVLIQRKAAVEFLGELDESVESAQRAQVDKSVARLRREAAIYHRYCSEAAIHLRKTDLDIVQPKPVSRDQGDLP